MDVVDLVIAELARDPHCFAAYPDSDGSDSSEEVSPAKRQAVAAAVE
jgi:hypothetical protein